MATHTLTVVYPDGDGPRIITALKSHYGQIEDPEDSGIFRDMTTGESLDRFDASIRQALRHIVLKEERQAAVAAASAAIEEVPIT
jgi:hypothetical protein